MAHQIKYRFLHSLFRLFSYLADRSGGWQVFVKPKLILGGLIIGIGMTACQSNNGHESSKKPDSSKVKINADSTKSTNALNSESKQISTEKTKNEKVISMTTCYFQTPEDAALKQHDTIIKEEIVTDSTVFTIAEKMPEFPGGDIAAYLFKNMQLPLVSRSENHIGGRVICQFVVEKDGSITNVRVVRSVDPGLDKEAIRVISSMPKWIPGEQDGKKVRVRYTLPVNFRLQ
jgi:protein TonB